MNNLEVGGSSYILGNTGIGTTEITSPLLITGSDTNTGFTLRLQDSRKIDSAVFLDNGNVGLGTTAPITQLHIAGNGPTAAASITAGVGSGPYSAYVQGRYAYVVGGSDTNGVLQVYDVSNPSLPTSVASITTGASSLPFSVYVQGRYAHVANFNSKSLAIFDLGGSYMQQLETGKNGCPLLAFD